MDELLTAWREWRREPLSRLALIVIVLLGLANLLLGGVYHVLALVGMTMMVTAGLGMGILILHLIGLIRIVRENECD